MDTSDIIALSALGLSIYNLLVHRWDRRPSVKVKVEVRKEQCRTIVTNSGDRTVTLERLYYAWRGKEFYAMRIFGEMVLPIDLPPGKGEPDHTSKYMVATRLREQGATGKRTWIRACVDDSLGKTYCSRRFPVGIEEWLGGN